MCVPMVVCDGKVAVLVSPGFGAGWSTRGKGELASRKVFSPELVEDAESISDTISLIEATIAKAVVS